MKPPRRPLSRGLAALLGQSPTRRQPVESVAADTSGSAAAGGADANRRRCDKVTIQLTVDVELADDIRVFMVKEQTDSERARAAHAHVIRLLQHLAPHIDNAAGYARRAAQAQPQHEGHR